MAWQSEVSKAEYQDYIKQIKRNVKSLEEYIEIEGMGSAQNCLESIIRWATLMKGYVDKDTEAQNNRRK